MAQETFECELDAHIAESMNEPAFRAAFEASTAKYARAVTRICPFGNCTVDIDPVDRTIMGGAGPVGCGCDSLPGWRSPYYEGLPKPGWAGKAVGRHGGRIAASQRKHADHVLWLSTFAGGK